MLKKKEQGAITPALRQSSKWWAVGCSPRNSPELAAAASNNVARGLAKHQNTWPQVLRHVKMHYRYSACKQMVEIKSSKSLSQHSEDALKFPYIQTDQIDLPRYTMLCAVYKHQLECSAA